MARTNLALHGGPKAVTVEDAEGWRAFGTEEADLVEQLAEAEELSATGAGITREF